MVTAIQTNKFTSTTVAEIAYIIGVEILRKEVISKELGNRFEKYFLTDDLTSAQIKADLDALLDLVIVATNNNAVKYVNSNFNLDEIKVVNVANMASEALTTITSLNLVKDSLSDFVVEYLSAAEITDDIDLSDINLAGEINIVAATLQDVAYKLVDNNIIYISDIMNVDRVLLIPAAIVALDGIIDLAILDKLAIPVANYLRDTYVTDEHSFIGQMTDVNFYNDLEDATLLGDIRTIVKKVIDVYETKLEDYLSDFNNDTKLDYVLLADAFSEIYATIVSTAYAADKEENIIQLVMDLMQIDDSILPISNITDRFDFATDTTVIRNTLMYAAQNILAKPSFIYTTINEWKELNISNLIIHLTDNGTIYHTINVIKALVGTTNASTISEVAYVLGLAYAKQMLDNDYSDYTDIIRFADLTNAEVKADLDVIINILETIADNKLNTNVEAAIRQEFDYRDLVVSDLYPVLEVLVEAVLGTETTKNLNAIKDELGTTLTKALREYANITTDLADVNVKHETTIILEIVKLVIDLGTTNSLTTIGNYLNMTNNLDTYVTDANVYDLAAIIEKALTLEIVEKHGLDLYYELVYNELLSGTEIAKYADIALIYVDNNEFISDVKALLAIVRNLTDLSKFTYGLVTYAKDVYSNVDRYELSDEFIAALTPAIVAVLKTVIAKYDANVLVNEITNKYSLTSDVTLDVNNDADELSTLIEVLVDIVMSDMTYVSGLRNLTVTSLGSKMITNHNLTRVADAIDTAAETSVVRMAYDLALAYADRKADTVAGGRFNNVIATDLTVNEMTEDVKTLTAILRTLDSVDVESDLRAIRNGTIGVTDVNLVKYQPSISTILDKVAALHAINDMTELVVNVLDYVKVIDVTDEIRSALSTINYRDEFVVLSDAAEVFIPNMAVAFGDATTLTARQVIDYIKAYRTFDNDFATFEKVVDVIIDTLEVLEDSQILKGIAIAAYNKLIANNGSLPATVRDILSLDPSYTSDNFMNDYSKVLTIVKSVVNAKMYKVIYNRHLTAFEVLDNLDDELANIIKAVSTLDFLTINNNSKVVDIISIIASRVGVLSSLDQTKDQFATIDLPAEGLIFASMTTDMVKAFKVMQNYGRNIDLPILGETELIKSIVNIFGTYLTSETHNIVTRVLMNALVTFRIYSLTEKLGRPQEAFADDLTNEEVDDLCNDVKAVLELLIEAGVFTNGTINLTDATGSATNEKLVTAYEIINGHLTLSAKVERVLNAIVHRAYIVGSIDIDYSVMSLSNEQSALSDLVSPAVAIARDIMNAINSRDFDLAVSLTMENRINTLYVNAMYSEILHQLALPVINIILAGALTDKYAFLVFDENDGVTIDNIMDEIDLLFCAAREIVSVIDYSSGSLDFVFENFDNINNGIDLLISMKSVNGGTTDNLEEIFRYAIEKVLKVTLSDDVVAIDEVEIIKTIISKINPLVQTGAYDNKKITKAILSRTALYIVASIIDDIHDSVMLYEIKDQLIDKVSRIIPASVRDKVINLIKNTDAETLKADTLILSETLRIAAQANIYQNGEITIETKEQFNYIADAYEKAFTMSSIASRSEKLYEEVFKRIDLSSIDTNLDPIANVNKAIANEGWSWAKETEAIADLIRSLGDVTESGTKVVSGTKLNLNSIMDCTDPTALASVLKAINNTSSLRVVFISIIKDLDVTIGSLKVTEFYSDWLNAQLADGASMAPKAEWDAEIDTLVEIYLDSKDLNSNFATMTDEDVDSLVALLKQINHSKLFNINALTETPLITDALSNMVSSGSEVKLADTSTWSLATWDQEIDNLGTLLKDSIRVGATSSSFDISSLTEADITSLLTNLNNSQLVRTMIPTIIMDSLRDNDAEDLASDWLRTEYNNVTDDNSETVMSSVEEWNEEIPNLAKIVTRVDKIDFTNEANRSDLETVLRAINHSRLFSIDAVNTRLSSDSLMSKLGFAGKTLGTVTYVTVPGNAQQTEANKVAAWDAEITALLDLIDLARELNIIDGSASIESTVQDLDTEADIKEVLDTMNNSSLFRVLLPEMIVSTADTLGTGDYVSQWLRNEKVSMSEKSVWETENAKLAKVIAIINSSDINFSDFNSSSTLVEDATLFTAKKVLLAINDSKSFVIDPIVSVMNTVVNKVDGVSGIVLDANNVTNWETELDVLFGTFDESANIDKKGVYSLTRDLGTIDDSDDSLTKVGTLLDKMVESDLLYPALTDIFTGAISNTSLYESEEGDTLKINYEITTITAVNARIKDELTSISNPDERWSWTKEINNMKQIKKSIDDYNKGTTTIINVAQDINSVINNVKVSDGNGGYKPSLILEVSEDLFEQVKQIASDNYGINIEEHL